MAKVIAIGPEVTEVNEGDVVLCDWNKAVKTDDFFVIKEDDIVFVHEDYNE